MYVVNFNVCEIKLLPFSIWIRYVVRDLYVCIITYTALLLLFAIELIDLYCRIICLFSVLL